MKTNKIDTLKERLKQSSKYVKSILKAQEIPEYAVIFGTGLSYETLKQIDNKIEIPHNKIPHLRSPIIKSHEGKMIYSEINNTPILIMSGRTHYYEGQDIHDVVYPIHLLKELGIEKVIITSSVGGINNDLKQGDLMLVEDHINLTSINPLIGLNDSLGKRFLPCTDIYDKDLIQQAEKISNENGFNINKGTMFFLPGPSYETPAEFEAIKILGGDTIGWSTVPEALVAHYRNMKVLAINCITDSLNFKKETSLEEIIETANISSKNLYKIISDLIKHHDNTYK